MQRQTWSSRLSYILTVAGATIGFGATWRFPYLVGENGGGAYVLIFIIAMFLVGIPMILAENVIGRRAHTNSLEAFGGNFNGKHISNLWRFIGYMGLIGAFGIMGYYMVLGGWVISYITHIIGAFFELPASLDLSSSITKEQTIAFYNDNIENAPMSITIFTFIFVIINWFILRRGIIDGIEKSMKFLMPLLFLCLIAMVIRNITLDNALIGIKFYLIPDFSKITPELFLYVLGQVFFALSLGFGVMITLSSHLNKQENLITTATITCVINTLVAILAGFMIFPSLFSFGLPPDSGPSLVFKTLPIVFSQMHFGNLFAVVFFVLLITAALTTSLPIYEVIIAVLKEKFGFSRNTSINLTLGGIFLFGNLPCIFAYGPWREVLIFGKNIFDCFDYVSGNIFFVLTAFFISIYVGWILKEESTKELSNQGKIHSIIIPLWFYYVKFVIPIVILAIFIGGFTLKF